MVALSDNMVALSDSVVPMILHVNSQCVQCELFCQDSCVGCSPVRLCFVWGNGAPPGHPTIGGAMASNTVIKGNSKKGAFTGKAQLLNNTKSTSVSQTDAALAADASAAGGHYIAKAKSLWIGLQERCQRFEESCTTRC